MACPESLRSTALTCEKGKTSGRNSSHFLAGMCCMGFLQTQEVGQGLIGNLANQGWEEGLAWLVPCRKSWIAMNMWLQIPQEEKLSDVTHVCLSL